MGLLIAHFDFDCLSWATTGSGRFMLLGLVFIWTLALEDILMFEGIWDFWVENWGFGLNDGISCFERETRPGLVRLWFDGKAITCFTFKFKVLGFYTG